MGLQLEHVDAGQASALEPVQERLDDVQGGVGTALILQLGGQASSRRPSHPGLAVRDELRPLPGRSEQEAPHGGHVPLAVEGPAQG